jgi:hypothetical protein
MGLYLKKSFRAGPLRLNLSKSGLGLSGGVTGARIGMGPRGSYVHAGRQGLYYRKHFSSGRSRKQSGVDGDGWATLLFVVIAIGIGVWFFKWLIENPLILASVVVVAIMIPLIRWSVRFHRRKLELVYKNVLDSTFVESQSPPSTATLSALKERQKYFLKNDTGKKKIELIEADVYQAVLDKVLDDGFITKEESALIDAAEQVLILSASTRLQTKKEIFTAAYAEAIQDRQITKEELEKLNNLMLGLAIPQEEVRREMGIVREIVETQNLRPPFKPIPPEALTVKTQKSEKTFYQCSAKVLSKRRNRRSGCRYR